MSDLQTELFRWAATQPLPAGALLLLAGIVYGFFGFLVFRFLLAVTCAGLGWGVGTIAATATDSAVNVWGPAAALALAALSLKWERPAVAVASGGVWGTLAAYLAGLFDVPPIGVWVAGGVTGCLGVLFAVLNYRTNTVVLTTLQGVALLLVGFVALASNAMPAVGATFRQWASNQVLVVPVLMTMLFVAAYSYQAMCQRGDIRTG